MASFRKMICTHQKIHQNLDSLEGFNILTFHCHISIIGKLDIQDRIHVAENLFLEGKTQLLMSSI